ncbi:putative signaling protein [BD1-7 clade bacterium]|nr:putative signaling protein [BD1-7 clade bacterium]
MWARETIITIDNPIGTMKFLHSLIQCFERVGDRFIPQGKPSHPPPDIEQIYRYRLVAGMILATISMLAAFTFYYILINSFSEPGSIVTLTLCLSLSSYLVRQLFSLRKVATYTKVAHRMIASILAATTVGIFITGGPFGSITSVFLTLPCLIAFLLTNRRIALRFAALTYAIYCAYVVAGYLNYQFPQTIPADIKYSMEVALWVYYTSTLLILIMTYDGMTSRLSKQRQKEQDTLSYMATHDDLTALANRKHFDDQINQAIHRADRSNSHVALLLIDLNGFKPINDSFGHDAGDALLQHVSKQIRATVRIDDVAARIGGDEFAIIVQGDVDQEKIDRMLARLSENISHPCAYEDKQISVTGSIGVALYPHHANDAHSLRRAADEAMYSAKRNKQDWQNYHPTTDRTHLQ